ncbi:transporter substrate-binding domain-containing protein [Streptococcus loxodontisalivarius]|uniref:Glutamine transport system substrate-binding protein n=1 Tax=Streptococcus loxodontisalivarius TaxID=1349415 RepID=A0ABS2PUC9_9STRE|nr:transporter substrate-binding domain-containing protein [Streptococcus loxodontisalivarius]MBM7643659.1 putative glutamine transport system substrate-binding protein [Streptococcus loxodontisalivarius]
MKQVKKLLTVLAALSLLFIGLGLTSKVKADYSAATSAQVKAIQKAGVLKVGVKQDVPNFGYYNADTDAYEGMEIDIAKKLAKALGVKVEFTAVTAQTREALIDNGQLDIIIATYTITDERKENYSFSNPYYTDEVGFLVNKSSKISSISDLNGLTIGVAQGSTTKSSIEEYASAHNLTFNYVQLGSYPELAISLYAKRIAAFSVDKSILSGYVSNKTEILSEGFNTQEYGIATKKSNTELTAYINDLLAEWKSDGSLEKIYDKYDLTPATAE